MAGKSKAAITKTRPTNGLDAPTRASLRKAHQQNHELLEKGLLGIPAVAVAFTGSFFAAKSPSGNAAILLSISMACFILAVICMLCSYLTATLTIQEFFENSNKTSKSEDELWLAVGPVVKYLNLTGYSLVIFGMCFAFLTIISMK